MREKLAVNKDNQMRRSIPHNPSKSDIPSSLLQTGKRNNTIVIDAEYDDLANVADSTGSQFLTSHNSNQMPTSTTTERKILH